jgi:ATP-binding cassette subfamily B protein
MRGELLVGTLVNSAQGILKLGLPSVNVVGAGLFSARSNPLFTYLVFLMVAFSHQEGKQVLRDVSFTAKQGEITPLVGPSGGGRSTTARRAATFWDAGAGQILLGGQDIIAVVPETLLRSYSVVFQDVVLFNTSFMENIRIGRNDATDDEVIRAPRLAR